MSEIFLQYEGTTRTLPEGAGLRDWLEAEPEGLRSETVAATLDGEMIDLHTPLRKGGRLELITLDQDAALVVLRHSTSHIMAEAVQALFPGTKVGMGPAIDAGFYYDFDSEHTFTPEDLQKIEKEMKRIIASKTPFQREEISSDEAVALFRRLGEDYKIELIEQINEPTVSLYRHGDWLDLCRGPHLPDTRPIRAFKLLSVAGAYWRGDEKNKMLQRIYGTAFRTREELREHLRLIEEAKKRDHRILGRKLDLFSFNEEIGAGLPIFHPRGMRLRTLIEDWVKKEHFLRGYDMVQGPTLLKKELWVRSGHFEHYRENMYFTKIDETEYGIKPMNCLAHMLIYKSRLHSFRDLPKRYFELGLVHRHEKSGVLNGLFRLRCFTQDDAHIICTPEQLNDEVKGVIVFVQDIMGVFGFDYSFELSTKPKESMGSEEIWELATQALKTALDDLGLPYEINEGDGAFYGPKIDVQIKDCLGRPWQCATIQCDFVMPERFDLSYMGSDNASHRPVMIHRVILGSVERFLGILIEHFAGAFPLWISPVQVAVLTISEKALTHARQVAQVLKKADIRVEEDYRNEKIGFKIREWQKQKVPYMLVIGEEEAKTGTVAPRTRKGERPDPMPVEDFLARINKEIVEKIID